MTESRRVVVSLLSIYFSSSKSSLTVVFTGTNYKVHGPPKDTINRVQTDYPFRQPRGAAAAQTDNKIAQGLKNRRRKGKTVVLPSGMGNLLTIFEGLL